MCLNYNYLFSPLFLTPPTPPLGIKLSPSLIKEYTVTLSQAPSLTLGVNRGPTSWGQGRALGRGGASFPPLTTTFPSGRASLKAGMLQRRKTRSRVAGRSPCLPVSPVGGPAVWGSGWEEAGRGREPFMEGLSQAGLGAEHHAPRLT